MTVRLAHYGVALLAAIPLYCLLRALWRRGKKAPGQVYWPRELVLGAFVLFMGGLAAALLYGRYLLSPANALAIARERLRYGLDVNFVPFYNIFRFLRYTGQRFIVFNILGNILGFVPFGLGLPLLWRRWKNFFAVLLAGMGISVFAETVQLFIGRSTDVDDVILNTSGVILGFLLCLLLRGLFPGLRRLRVGRKKK